MELTGFEKTAITLLCESILSKEQLSEVLLAHSISYDYTGVGYFIEIEHSHLPNEKMVCDKPSVFGKDPYTKEIECGFIVFLGDGQLTLECHSYDSYEVFPENYRSSSPLIEVTK